LPKQSMPENEKIKTMFLSYAMPSMHMFSQINITH
jgi:hypothetical protein